MGARSWDELDAILDEALDLPTDKRPIFFDRLELEPSERERLEKLIAVAESDDDTLAAGGALGGRRGEQIAALLDDEEASGPPDAIPGYRLLRRIGSGGMGHVWEADQLDPVRRRVAVKIIRPEKDTGRVVARFESERQTLALMNHPGIAQIFDAGVTESGRPFFTMEFVDGLPLTAFCDEHRLSVRERLELFLDVCDAVQHAHQKGVIHRDLKPPNVLVGFEFGGLRAILEARRRLLDPSAQVLDVALEAGYSNPTHFARAFRRWAGLTPVAYRTARASAIAAP